MKRDTDIRPDLKKQRLSAGGLWLRREPYRPPIRLFFERPARQRSTLNAVNPSRLAMPPGVLPPKIMQESITFSSQPNCNSIRALNDLPNQHDVAAGDEHHHPLRYPGDLKVAPNLRAVMI